MEWLNIKEKKSSSDGYLTVNWTIIIMGVEFSVLFCILFNQHQSNLAHMLLAYSIINSQPVKWLTTACFMYGHSPPATYWCVCWYRQWETLWFYCCGFVLRLSALRRSNICMQRRNGPHFFLVMDQWTSFYPFTYNHGLLCYFCQHMSFVELREAYSQVPLRYLGIWGGGLQRTEGGSQCCAQGQRITDKYDLV